MPDRPEEAPAFLASGYPIPAAVSCRFRCRPDRGAVLCRSRWPTPSSPACPAYYGLYAAFLPVIVAALWVPRTSSHGPVAVVSLDCIQPGRLSRHPAPSITSCHHAGVMSCLPVGIGCLSSSADRHFLSHPVHRRLQRRRHHHRLSQINKLWVCRLAVPQHDHRG